MVLFVFPTLLHLPLLILVFRTTFVLVLFQFINIKILICQIID